MILLFTTAVDPTANLLVERLGGRVFRLNHELHADYALAMTPDGWSLSSPGGLAVTSETVSAVFWWKASTARPVDQDPMIAEEVRYVLREMYHGCRARGLAKGNPPDFHDRLGKIAILGIAKRHFHVPSTLVSFGLSGVEELAGAPVVAKSLSSRLTADGRVLYATEVEPAALHPGYPWFLQQRVDSMTDLTVFVCGDRLFAFERSRQDLVGLDWREASGAAARAPWKPYGLSPADRTAVKGLLRDLCVDWGRIDLMRDADGRSVFLEFNANGQWAFLDPDHRIGLADAVVDYLTDRSSQREAVRSAP